MGKMIESGGGKKKARKVTITIGILNFPLISVRQEYQEKCQGKNSHFLRKLKNSPIPIQVGFLRLYQTRRWYSLLRLVLSGTNAGAQRRG
jgi:hypothetical protein